MVKKVVESSMEDLVGQLSELASSKKAIGSAAYTSLIKQFFPNISDFTLGLMALGLGLLIENEAKKELSDGSK